MTGREQSGIASRVVGRTIESVAWHADGAGLDLVLDDGRTLRAHVVSGGDLDEIAVALLPKPANDGAVSREEAQP